MNYVTSRLRNRSFYAADRSRLTALIMLAGSLLFAGIAYADPTVELQILNATGVSGEVIVVAGEDVEVNFDVTLDSQSVLGKKDKLELKTLMTIAWQGPKKGK